MNTTVVNRVLSIPMDANINGTNAHGLDHGITSAVSLMQLVIVSSGAYPELHLGQVSLKTYASSGHAMQLQQQGS